MNATTPSPHSQCITFRAKAETLERLRAETEKTEVSTSKIINSEIRNAFNILISEAKAVKQNE